MACQNHNHQHGKSCGHTAVKHGDHVDYLHDGHLHHQTEGGVEEQPRPCVCIMIATPTSI